jgi:hypothetical protein
MKSTIKDILAKIESLDTDLREEYIRLSEKYGFSLEKRKVIFVEEIRKHNKAMKLPKWKFPLSMMNIRQIIAIPFILGMIIPAIFLDICITIYHAVAFPLYGIPRVKRYEYIIFDRRFLDYLNIIQKVQCLYCSYVNGLFAYAVEIAARTERYWCPLKAAHKPKFSHGWYKDFADYGNPEEWKEKYHHDEKSFKPANTDTSTTQ